MAPLWLGLVPFGAAFGVLARAAGLSAWQAQAMSALVFAGGSQLNAVGMVAAGAGTAAIVASTLLINLRHVLYGLSVAQRVTLPRGMRWLWAHLLTDEAFGVLVASGERSAAFLLGAELSVFIPWNVATAAGVLLGGVLPDPSRSGMDVIFPVAFAALLAITARSSRAWAAAALAGAVAWMGSRFTSTGMALLAASIVGSAGAAFVPPKETTP